MIFSIKTSGIGLLQELLCGFGSVCQQTLHRKFDTIARTKVASILGLPRLKMQDTVVPIQRERAIRNLRTLLSRKIADCSLPDYDARLILDGWRARDLAPALDLNTSPFIIPPSLKSNTK
jgi:hypothetical protein